MGNQNCGCLCGSDEESRPMQQIETINNSLPAAS